jgi:[ribosomal protein S5]-alanine N-acetyltransferase
MITLDPIPVSDLAILAESIVPAELRGIALEGALPPAFVAARSLDQIHGGKPTRWCSTFYIRETDQTIVGGCGFKDAPCNGRVEIGYAVSPLRRNRGIATSAVRSLVSLAFESGEVSEILAQVNEINSPSTRVVEKLGFLSSSVLTDQYNTALVQWVLRTLPNHSFKADASGAA